MTTMEGKQSSLSNEIRPRDLQRHKAVGIVDQSTRLPLRRVLPIFAVLQLVLFISYMDQTSVSTVLPQISNDLGSAEEIGWVGTALLIATCSSQMVLARFSDIFGRKIMLTSVILIFVFGNILCGFAKNSIWLFSARGVSGIGSGGINSLVMIIVSDIVSLQERGRFQGLLSIAIGLGNGLGPLIGGGLSTISWRWAFWISPPFLCASLLPIWLILPQKPLAGNTIEKVKQIDYVGSVLSMASSILFLVPISSGGVIFAWNSTVVIVMLVVSGVATLAFLMSQHHVKDKAVLPLRLFKYRTVALVFSSTLCQGWVHYGQIFYLPLYFQDIRGQSSVMSGVLLLPMIALQPIMSATCGQVTTRTGYVVPLMQLGFTVWVIAAGLLFHFAAHTSLGYIIGTLVVAGIGVGMTMQTSLVSAQAGAPARDRAVVTGARNTARSLGGAVGLAACGSIRNALTRRHLSQISGVPSEVANKVVSSGISAVRGEVDSSTLEQLKTAVMSGIHGVYLSFIPLIGAAMLLSWLVPNHRIFEKPPSPPLKQDEEASAEASVVQRSTLAAAMPEETSSPDTATNTPRTIISDQSKVHGE